MKYTKLFNKHSDYDTYIYSENAVFPNVSWCMSEEELHYEPSSLTPCPERHRYSVSDVLYPSTVPATATSFSLSFSYVDSFTARTCDETTSESSNTVSIAIEENLSESARTINGSYDFNGIAIPYSLTQEGSVDYSERYLTFDVVSGGTIMWVASSGVTRTISYSKDDGTTWTEITSAAEGAPINVDAGNKVLLKGNNTRYGLDKDSHSSFSGGTAYYNVEGNIMSLIGGDDFTGLTSFNNNTYVFCSMFNGSNVVSARGLILPVMTLTESCYRSMFANNPNLINTPSLPATIMASYCYYYMFANDTSLTASTELLSTSLSNKCYNDMFLNCSSLTVAPSTLPATILKSGCYMGMFRDCTSLTVVPNVLPATNTYEECYRGMFRGCTSITTAPVIYATTMASQSCREMFRDCTSLTIVQKTLSATSVVYGSYYGMFRDCTSLTVAPELPATSVTNGSCYCEMFAGCTSLTAAPDLPATTLTSSGYKSMFSGCTSLTKAPDLLAETIPDSCYMEMFKNCTKLSYVKCLARDKSGNQSHTFQMMYNVAPVGTFVKYVNTDWWTVGDNNGIPTGWTIENEGVETPIISCDGENITIICNTPDAAIYYQLNNSGNFVEYTSSIEITADTIVKAYAQQDEDITPIVTETCIYSPRQLVTPTISCDGENVTITCLTEGSTVYYRLDSIGNYIEYTTPIVITADTFVEAYSSLDGSISTVVSYNCIYVPIHHYENDYLTLDVLTGGTINWVAKNNVAKTIYYSINNGEWNEITATSTGTPISVSVGDKVRLKGTNDQYSSGQTKNYCSCFSGGTAYYNVEGNIMSLISGDSFTEATAFTKTWVFHSLFDNSKVVSAENLILPVMSLTTCCYRAMFANAHSLIKAPELPATTLAEACYWYMFENAPITKAPELNATTLVKQCYGGMFTGCTSLNYIKCIATSINASSATTSWVKSVASSGVFVKAESVTSWSTGDNGIPTNWTVYDDGVSVLSPTISYDGLDKITITCQMQNASIYYKLDNAGSYILYTTAITITADTFIEAYSEFAGQTSTTVSYNCKYVSDVPYDYSNRNLTYWTLNNQEITTPYSINAIDGQSSNYAKGTFNFETTVGLRTAQPTYLWFQHADQSATIYVDNVEVEKHWGGYNAFFTDITNYVHSGSNVVKVALKNNEGNNLAPATGDFNFNATLGNVKLFTSPYMPAMNYGYDGFHITSTVSTASATINVATNIPTGASVVCTISGANCNYTATSASTGDEMIFTTTISNPRLWNGTIDPYLYNVKVEIYHNNELYHSYERPYGLRFYEYVINQTINGNSYTGFLLNGQPYLLRGCCMHDDIAGKANALNNTDYTQQFNLISDLGLNFLRLAHYPHPKEVYDWCDRLGIIVETEVPCVNSIQTTMPEAYWTHLVGQYNDMVNQHYNHPCIAFWGLSNEAKVTDSTEGREFAKTKIEAYTSQIKALDSERLVGLVGHALTDPITYFGKPTNIDWIGSNLYEGWYQNTSSNNPTSRLNTCLNNTVSSSGVAYAFSEYGCGGTQLCHSDSASTTTNKGSGGARHDIEYQMWLHEGHIAAIKNFPQILFTSQWVLFDFAVSNRNEGYTICLDGVNTMTDESLRRLNDKGLVERDHVTKKDTYYLYKAWWNTSDKFVHICGKDYQKTQGRVIKCYSNDGNSLSLYVNNTLVETVAATNNICTFTATNFNNGDIIRVDGNTTSDSFIING